MKVIVIGAGIGGLALTKQLLDAGFDVQVYEQMRELREFGAGVYLGPNAVRIMHNLGYGEKLKAIALEPNLRIVTNGETGEELRDPSRNAEAEIKAYGYPSNMVHRGDVHEF